jgi:DNA/RNA endonuclease YhcR with UshA esterase domain
LLLGLVGVLVLAVADEKPVEVSKIDSSLVGRKVVLAGSVESKRVTNDNVFLSVGGSQAVIFMHDAARLPVNPYFFAKGQFVRLVGVVREYKGGLELVVEGVLP